MKDEMIIKEIKNGRRNKPLEYLYKELPKIQNSIVASGGSKEIAQEIFNDSLLILIEKVESPDFQLTSKLSTYLFGIVRLLWMNELRRQNKLKELEWSNVIILTNEDIGYDHDKEVKLLAIENILQSISDKCKKLFDLFYFQKKSMKQIVTALGFSNINSAKTQKYKCMEKAIQLSKNL